MKFTKRQRHRAYKYVYKRIKNDGLNGIAACIDLRIWVIDHTPLKGFTTGEGTQLFPEFFAKKPKNKSLGDCWWKAGSEKRLLALQKCINETAPIKKKTNASSTKRKR